MKVNNPQNLAPELNKISVSTKTDAPLKQPKLTKRNEAIPASESEDMISLSEAALQVSPKDVQRDSKPEQERLDHRETEETRKKDDMEFLADQLGKAMDASMMVKFDKDQETGENLVLFVEKESGKVIRQVPSEEALEFTKRFQDSVSGIFISEDA